MAVEVNETLRQNLIVLNALGLNSCVAKLFVVREHNILKPGKAEIRDWSFPVSSSTILFVEIT